MTRDLLEEAFLRLRHAAHADEYVPMERVIDAVLKRLRDAERERDEARESLSFSREHTERQTKALETIAAALVEREKRSAGGFVVTTDARGEP